MAASRSLVIHSARDIVVSSAHPLSVLVHVFTPLQAYRAGMALLPDFKKEKKARIAPNHINLYYNLANLLRTNESRLEEADEVRARHLGWVWNSSVGRWLCRVHGV